MKEVAHKTKGNCVVEIFYVESFERIEKHNWRSIIHDTFPKDQTVKKWCLILIKHLNQTPPNMFSFIKSSTIGINTLG